MTSRYRRNAMAREHDRYSSRYDTCPFRQDLFVDEEYIMKPRRDRKKSNVMRSLIYEDLVKEVTKRLTVSTISSARKAQLAHVVVEGQDGNRNKLMQQFGAEGRAPRSLRGMYTNEGTLRHQGRSGQWRGEPVAPSNKQFYIDRSVGGPASKPLGVEMYNIPTPHAQSWRTIHSAWAANRRHDTGDFKLRRPRDLARYSVHNSSRVDPAKGVLPQARPLCR